MKRIGFAATFVLCYPLLAYPQTTGTNTPVIHACAKIPKGELRIVGSSGACVFGEVPIEWSVIGPAGPPGAGALRVFDSAGKALGAWLQSYACINGTCGTV